MLVKGAICVNQPWWFVLISCSELSYCGWYIHVCVGLWGFVHIYFNICTDMYNWRWLHLNVLICTWCMYCFIDKKCVMCATKGHQLHSDWWLTNELWFEFISGTYADKTHTHTYTHCNRMRQFALDWYSPCCLCTMHISNNRYNYI